MATFTLDDWDYDDTSPDKYILNGWTGSTTETEIYIPGEYNGRQISLKDLKIFPSSMTHLELEEVNGKKVQLETTNLSESFRYRSKIIHIDLSGLDTGNVTNMSCMFNECSGLTSVDVSRFDMTNVTDMSYMFSDCGGGGGGVTDLSLRGFQMGNVLNMSGMFSGCSGFTGLDVSGFDTKSVTNMNSMFEGCSELTSLDLGRFNLENVQFKWDTFKGCTQLKIIDLGQCQWTTADNLFGFQSNIPLIIISPSTGI
ncbi:MULTISPECIES: BspA family leucine-rich repeat surface protein [unclassified Turicibacter]|uniref:BspA family leucine-rich repeat surface protein n=1 Tax=unclassified Turicibacter TaxID=2638206 RepID=UPI00137A2244|nr:MULTISPECIES: BspA family leucine-rich repeat surface protein [unclassified Turicibacter]MCU7204328.1 BspA family leucine-rich repeat surface protein [Turicibacter sp. TA25]MCU7210207.1 BspA family leucine-rich repeat surface protein [Turicibacter sp. 1E2]NCE79017.1 BspA family leucine-rich repeat surface protein [Turicibacter sp. TS3]